MQTEAAIAEGLLILIAALMVAVVAIMSTGRPQKRR